MKKLKTYADEISNATPGQLSDILVSLTADYGEVCDSLIPIRRAKMQFWVEHKKLEAERPVSDQTVKALWVRDGEGELEERMSLYKECLGKMMSNVKAILREKEHEARNLM